MRSDGGGDEGMFRGSGEEEQEDEGCSVEERDPWEN